MQATRPLLIDAREAGQLLNMLPSRVTRLAKRGVLPCVVLPDGELRYSEDDLRSWIEEYRRLGVVNTEGRRNG
jgi:predicted site-specific integrase-resolvase